MQIVTRDLSLQSEKWTEGCFLKEEFDSWTINKKIKIPQELPGPRVLPSPISVNILQLQGKKKFTEFQGYFKHQEEQKFYFCKICKSKTTKIKFKKSSEPL